MIFFNIATPLEWEHRYFNCIRMALGGTYINLFIQSGALRQKTTGGPGLSYYISTTT
jgi:hypothetical protein